jgi:phosphocarrier protein HPr
MVTKQLILINKLGMHARPAAMFVKITSKYKAEVMVEKDGEEVNGKSIMGLMMLAAGCGSKLKISADGPDADQLVSDIEQLIQQKFNED